MTGVVDLRGADEATLVRAIAQWRDEAVAEVYRRHASAVRDRARRIVIDRERAEEVVQELFLRLWDVPLGFDASRGSLRSYLLTQCQSRCIDHLRAEAARRHRELRFDREPRVAPLAVELEVLRRTDAATVRGAVRRLPFEERRVLVLAFFDGLSYSDVARFLGHPEGTVKTRIRSALHRLRGELDDLAPLGPDPSRDHPQLRSISDVRA